ncbi:MerR family transcriptional regulator [Streptomyces sp. NPDC057496]|uniref:MerR family transcriptional regulator n=1 Tax=Streptomyces sp. NPDC057496 TaxID=3346149 RepID=UPI0036A1B3E4
MTSPLPLPAFHPDHSNAHYTVAEISRLVGMSPRNIRAHQSRKLLQPPTRKGRIGYYDETHVRRLQHIVSLQRQGFNLVSIAAFLGVGDHDDEEGRLAAAVNRAVRDQPGVFHCLNRHGMLGWEADGTVTISRPGVQRAAMELVRAGIPPTAVLRCLARLLDRIANVAEELVTSSSAELMPVATGFTQSPAPRPADAPPTDRFTEGLVDLLVNAFRAAAEERCRELVTDILMADGGSEAWIEEHLVVENG